MKKPENTNSKNKHTRERNLTVFSKSFERSYHRQVFFPEIRIAGKWVLECGFEPGDRVVVKVQKNQIILKKQV